jgi:hypothetical protein
LKANDSERADVGAGETVFFRAGIEVPPGTGKVVSAHWDFEGDATFPVEAELRHSAEDVSRTVVEAKYDFSRPGTYFPVLRAASHRDGDGGDPYTQVLNLCRVRVAVH